MNYINENNLMAPLESYQSYLQRQLTQCCCSLAVQQQTALIHQQTQSVLSQLNNNLYSASLLPYGNAQEYYNQCIPTNCCDDESSTRPKKTNCVNCGATLQGKHKCIYCGTYNE